jgi:hypothetical protein
MDCDQLAMGDLAPLFERIMSADAHGTVGVTIM